MRTMPARVSVVKVVEEKTIICSFFSGTDQTFNGCSVDGGGAGGTS